MRYLVTGASGFLGSHLARALSARGDVRVLVRPTSDRRRLAGLAVEEAVGDVTDAASVERAMEGVDVVFHAAAMYEFGPRDPALMARTNVGGTRNVLEAAAARGLLAVFVSSTAALGPTGSVTEDEAHRSSSEPHSAYEATKRAAHDLALELAAPHPDGMGRIRIACPGTIYGPDDPSLGGRFHRLYAKGLIRVGFLPDMKMTLVHVDDCADGLIRIAERGKDGETYILAAQTATFRDWFEGLARAAGRKPPRVFVGERALQRLKPLAALGAPLVGLSSSLAREAIAMSAGAHWAYSGDKARRELGWSPRPLDEGLADTLAWYRGKEGSRARVLVP
ncbi:MAG TPA: NAD-dependent epimerase/dehydratase family protein [Actinomycetota bacterium]|nr:NAD-dependent epimerase/dehydratase family protein [Actinomycetota bacterium]